MSECYTQPRPTRELVWRILTDLRLKPGGQWHTLKRNPADFNLLPYHSILIEDFLHP